MALLTVKLPTRLCTNCFTHLSLESHMVPRERHAGLRDQMHRLLPASGLPGVHIEPQKLEAGLVQEKD